jgi:hypothetical protein
MHLALVLKRVFNLSSVKGIFLPVSKEAAVALFYLRRAAAKL